jgi:TetR/AcrR family transcriptional regulator, regulator of cefoperazone and chloramphenicol sensitivity
MPKTQVKVSPKQRILNETIDLIGKDCKLKFTTRELSKKADVNLASINYYYNSKGELVKQAEEFLTEKIEKAYAELGNTKRDVKDNLMQWADSMIDLLIEYPGVMYVWSWKVIIGKHATKDFLDIFYSPENPITKVLTKAMPKAKPELVNYKSIQLVSDIMNPFIFNQSAIGKRYFDMKSDKSRKQYLEMAINSALSA